MLTLHPYDYNGLELYHLSPVNHDGELFYPRVPESRMISEDAVTPRVCFGPSLLEAYYAVETLRRHNQMDLMFVHVPDNIDELKAFNAIVSPDDDDVPDASKTGELWSLDPVKMKCMGLVLFYTRYERVYPDGECGWYNEKNVTRVYDVIDDSILDRHSVFMDELTPRMIEMLKDIVQTYEPIYKS